MHISFLHQVGKGFCHYFFNYVFNLFPSLLLLASPWWECWYTWSCLRDSLYYPHFFGFFFLFLWMGIPYVPNCLFDSRLHPLYCWYPVNILHFISVSVSFISDWSFFYAADVLCSPSILITSVLNSVPSRLLLFLFCLVLFLEFCSDLSYVSLSHFGCLPGYVFMYQ